MKEQNFKNHSQIVPAYHIVTYLAVLALLIGSFVNLANSSHDNLYSASLICLIALILVSLTIFTRSFALKAQDRAIRAEENFRHFYLTNTALDSRLNMSQVIALRFASDAEFPPLAKKAAEEGMAAKDIKQAIKNWRGDYYRL
ncbi:hypothetical protein EXU57_03880 [Segetibacter sp. 3557_3]|uniref:DUF6526 family protein n=1 Tax=Segetibacter sp. 3557_3 TaxID=2547429 RepID=UPI001058D278|nr:DUF6526 family protein [Segetibacter sp. 3557_3]TDH29216.1 hypothetical protein EXU57_03880 [Segetibacter sp. 3557_3]